MAAQLLSNLREGQARLYASGSAHLWALEAHELGVTEAYGRLGAIGRNGRASLSDADIQAASAAVALQMTRAGVRLAYVINEALAPSPAAPRVVAPRGNRAKGRAVALASCSVCHVVAPDQASPVEFTIAPDFNSIANTGGITEDSLREFLFGPHPSMPNLTLDGAQANDVIAFILSLRTPEARK